MLVSSSLFSDNIFEFFKRVDDGKNRFIHAITKETEKKMAKYSEVFQDFDKQECLPAKKEYLKEFKFEEDCKVYICMKEEFGNCGAFVSNEIHYRGNCSLKIFIYPTNSSYDFFVSFYAGEVEHLAERVIQIYKNENREEWDGGYDAYFYFKKIRDAFLIAALETGLNEKKIFRDLILESAKLAVMKNDAGCIKKVI